ASKYDGEKYGNLYEIINALNGACAESAGGKVAHVEMWNKKENRIYIFGYDLRNKKSGEKVEVKISYKDANGKLHKGSKETVVIVHGNSIVGNIRFLAELKGVNKEDIYENENSIVVIESEENTNTDTTEQILIHEGDKPSGTAIYATGTINNPYDKNAKIKDVGKYDTVYYGNLYDIVSALNGKLVPQDGSKQHHAHVRMFSSKDNCYYFLDYDLSDCSEGEPVDVEIFKDGFTGEHAYWTYGVIRNGNVTGNIRYLAELRGIRNEDIHEGENGIVVDLDEDRLGKNNENEQEGTIDEGEFSFPINDGTITSLYGPRGSKFHTGVDIARVPEGTPVYAITDGKLIIGVNKGNSKSGYGNYLRIEFGKEKNWALYGHLKDELPEVIVKELKKKYSNAEENKSVFLKYRNKYINVKKGQIIGYVSHSGYCEPEGADHLHFTLVMPTASDRKDDGSWGEKDSVDPITRINFNFPVKETIKDEYDKRYGEKDNIEEKIKSNSDCALEKAILLTTSFEGSGYVNVTGNFDGAGISIGIFQWNIGQGTLQPMLKKFFDNNSKLAKQIFGDNYQDIINMLGSSKSNQMEWARSINDGKNLKTEWYNQFVALCETSQFQQIQRDAMNEYTNQAYKIANDYDLKTERGLALALDIAVQNWDVTSTSRTEIKNSMRNGSSEQEVLQLLAQAAVDKVNDTYKADVRTRKFTIVNGTGTVHGKKFDIEKEYGITNARFR
ncbi:MAG: M23 family metallopeptidase, partial [Clostridia bacterium]|nr:M23 family metallopeptidase [Clostridia bacterium]